MKKGLETLGGGRVCTGQVPYTEIHKKDGTPGRGHGGKKGRKQEKNTGMD